MGFRAANIPPQACRIYIYMYTYTYHSQLGEHGLELPVWVLPRLPVCLNPCSGKRETVCKVKQREE